MQSGASPRCAGGPRPDPAAGLVTGVGSNPLYAAGHWTPELVRLAWWHRRTWPPRCAQSPNPLVGGAGVATRGPRPRLLRPGPVPESRWNWPHSGRCRALRSCPGVASGQLFVIDGDAYFSRSGPRLVDRPRDPRAPAASGALPLPPVAPGRGPLHLSPHDLFRSILLTGSLALGALLACARAQEPLPARLRSPARGGTAPEWR